MKPKRLKHTSKTEEDSTASSIARSYFIQEEKEGKVFKTGVEISQEVIRQFVPDRDLIPRLTDEIRLEKAQFIIDECVAMMSSGPMTVAHWTAVTNFLRDELENFRELKEDLATAERKLVMVSQRLNEATHPVDGVVRKTHVMACSMVFGETEMRRDHLKARVLVIIEELTKRIIARLGGIVDQDMLEIRLRGVFGNL